MKSHTIYYDLKFLSKGPISLLFSILITLTLFNHGFADNSDVEMSRSPNDLQFDWVLSEILFVSQLRNLDTFHLKEKTFHKELESYLTDFDDTVSDLRGYGGSPTEKATAICNNPIASHRVIRRIAYVLPDLRKNIKADADLVKYDKNFPSNNWITAKEVNDSMHGILRVHNVYDLDVELFADGIISRIHTGAKLLGVHCYEIGVYAHNQEFHTLSVQWLQLALSKSEVDKTVDKNLIDCALQAAIHIHDEAFNDRWELDPYFFTQRLINSTDANFGNSSSVELPETQRKRLVKEYKGRKETVFNDVNFWELCTNGGFKSLEEQSKLFCWLETKVHVYWLINPLKMEMLTRNPDVYQVYDVIRDERISKIQELATSTLELSMVVDFENPGQSKLSEVRTSMNTWIDEGDYPETALLPLRIQQITGINVVEPSSSEQLQIASYTFSAHYDVHQDALKTEYEYGFDGERIATFMYYLSDVELGGRTAFPQGGIAASPVKGSAVFWYDIHTDGEADDDTFHGACPVLLGKKWVANKWIRYYDQFLIRKCSLKENERFTVSVNSM